MKWKKSENEQEIVYVREKYEEKIKRIGCK